MVVTVVLGGDVMKSEVVLKGLDDTQVWLRRAVLVELAMYACSANYPGRQRIFSMGKYFGGSTYMIITGRESASKMCEQSPTSRSLRRTMWGLCNLCRYQIEITRDFELSETH